MAHRLPSVPGMRTIVALVLAFTFTGSVAHAQGVDLSYHPEPQRNLLADPVQAHTLRNLHERLSGIERDAPPFTRGLVRERDARWVHPELVAQIGFSEWTRDGKLRHPRYQGLRTDKEPRDVVRETR